MNDLLITGGTVIDGTGSPGRRADLRVRQGRVAEIGPGLAPQGEPVIDAARCRRDGWRGHEAAFAADSDMIGPS